MSSDARVRMVDPDGGEHPLILRPDGSGGLQPLRAPQLRLLRLVIEAALIRMTEAERVAAWGPCPDPHAEGWDWWSELLALTQALAI